MNFTLRLLLTSKCNARCAYCHNEGQTKDANLLSYATIEHILQQLGASNCLPKEIVLSGGEPTLHKEVAKIARLCKNLGIYVSMDSHGGNPSLLAPVLPFLDELKLHIDSFEAIENLASMGIQINATLRSIEMAKQFPALQLRTNHPMKSLEKTKAFVQSARSIGIDCKIIEMLDARNGHIPLVCANWAAMGYEYQPEGFWLYPENGHRVFTLRCNQHHNAAHTTLFVSAEGIRYELKSAIISSADDFSLEMLSRWQALCV